MTEPVFIDEQILKVAAASRAKSVAGALAPVIRQYGRAAVDACGAGAVNEAVKAIAICRGYVTADGLDLITVPVFQERMFGTDERTLIRFIVEPR